MLDVLKENLGSLAWAYCIIAGVMLMPAGDSGIMKIFGLAGIAIGIGGFLQRRNAAGAR